jgi:hypothetical protein
MTTTEAEAQPIAEDTERIALGTWLWLACDLLDYEPPADAGLTLREMINSAGHQEMIKALRADIHAINDRRDLQEQAVKSWDCIRYAEHDVVIDPINGEQITQYYITRYTDAALKDPGFLLEPDVIEFFSKICNIDQPLYESVLTSLEEGHVDTSNFRKDVDKAIAAYEQYISSHRDAFAKCLADIIAREQEQTTATDPVDILEDLLPRLKEDPGLVYSDRTIFAALKAMHCDEDKAAQW